MASCDGVTINQGETLDQPFNITQDGVAADISALLGYLELSVRLTSTGCAATPLIYKSTQTVTEWEVDDAVQGQTTIHFLPEDTQSLASGTYVIDFWLVTGDVPAKRRHLLGPVGFQVDPSVSLP